jgi:uncharacterized protein (DUF983 family)
MPMLRPDLQVFHSEQMTNYSNQPKRRTPLHIIRVFVDGLWLRCPRCHTGRMFDGFTMRRACPVCGLLFEEASGEATGGMAINIVATLFIVIASALIFGPMTSIPLLPVLLGLGLVTILFPIAFYRSSRGLWVAFLYLTGGNQEPD